MSFSGEFNPIEDNFTKEDFKAHLNETYKD